MLFELHHDQLSTLYYRLCEAMLPGGFTPPSTG